MEQPQIRLSEAEADAYTEALSEFARWHLPAFKVNGKRGSEIALVFTLAMIYGPKVGAIVKERSRKPMEAAPALAA